MSNILIVKPVESVGPMTTQGKFQNRSEDKINRLEVRRRLLRDMNNVSDKKGENNALPIVSRTTFFSFTLPTFFVSFPACPPSAKHFWFRSCRALCDSNQTVGQAIQPPDGQGGAARCNFPGIFTVRICSNSILVADWERALRNILAGKAQTRQHKQLAARSIFFVIWIYLSAFEIE